MQYRKFGRQEFTVSALGFGAMRLPTKDEQIDEAETRKMVYYAIDQGVNYVDTAYGYHRGKSEVVMGKVLQGEYRDKVKLATKLPCWKVEEPADFDRLFNEQRERLQTERIDCYLLHALSHDRWPKVRDFGVLEWAEQKMADGQIGCLGFSFHDEYPVFTEIVDAYDWAFCQIQYNYMQTEHQAGVRGLHYAAEKGLAVIVMEPIMGGQLVDPPTPVQQIWDTSETRRSAADWALQWLWSQPEVSFVLSGMSAMQHVEENVASARMSKLNLLSDAELLLFDKVREQYQQLSAMPCTKCEYCMPCPSGVNIPRNFDIYNQSLMYDKAAWARRVYNRSLAEEKRASACTQCKACEELCPQNIPISQWMPVVHSVLGEGQPFQTRL